jgi:hypothetical protein
MYQLKIDKESLKKYDYKTVQIAGFKKLKELNLPDNYFGGRVHRIVVLRNEDNMLITDEYHNIIGILIPEKKEVKEEKLEVKKEKKKSLQIVEEKTEEIEEEAKEESSEESKDEIEESPKVKFTYSCERCDKEFNTALKLGAHKRFCKVEKTGGEEQ